MNLLIFPQASLALNIGIMLFLLVLVSGAILLLKQGFLLKKYEYPYKKINFALTPSEKNFFLALEDGVRKEFRVWPKIRIADLLAVDKVGCKSAEWTAFNRIAAKHIDFVLVDKKNMKIIAGVELDDRSHNREDRIQRDKFVDKAFHVAKVPLIRFRSAKFYDSGHIRGKIFEALTDD